MTSRTRTPGRNASARISSFSASDQLRRPDTRPTTSTRPVVRALVRPVSEPKTSRTARALVKDDKHPGYGQTGKAALRPRLLGSCCQASRSDTGATTRSGTGCLPAGRRMSSSRWIRRRGIWRLSTAILWCAVGDVRSSGFAD